MPFQKKKKTTAELNQKRELYGLLWDAPTFSPAGNLWREIEMVKRGGQWKDAEGKTIGEGNLFHFKKAISLLWPEIIWHAWFELVVENYLTHRTVIIIGPASSGKTFDAAICVLMDYYCFPGETTVIVCSTTRDRLEERIFGELKKYHRMATQRFSWLSGHLIEGKQRIVTDDRSEAEEGRDFRNGICFPADSMVDTPAGPKAIEDIVIGDVVLNSIGTGQVTQLHNSFSPSLVRIRLNDGRKIDCTPNHPILTQKGWTKAIDLAAFDMVFSQYETLSIMRDSHSKQYNLLLSEMCRPEAVSILQENYRRWLSKSKVLFQEMPRLFTSKSMRAMRETISSLESSVVVVGEKFWKILQSNLFRNVGISTQRMQQKFNKTLQALRKNDGERSFFKEFLFCGMSKQAGYCSLPPMRKRIYLNSRSSAQAKVEVLWYDLQKESDRCSKFEEKCASHSGGTCCLEVVSPINYALQDSNRVEGKGREKTLVSDRYSISEFETSGRSGWGSSQHPTKIREGQNKNNKVGGTWVESVEILEPRCDERFRKSQGGYPVFNISVDGHPSYSVNGIIVHNCGVPCLSGGSWTGLGSFIGIKNKRVRLVGDELSLLPRTFVDSISNLDKNTDFKLVGLGNPKETTDALGILGEPAAFLGGWDGGIDQTPKTKTWQTRRTDGICIQLVGTDSPNLDGKLGIPLITQEQIDRDVSFYGKDSIWFSMMDQGMMPRGQGSRRVITRQMCQKFGALNDPLWLNPHRTKIAFLDAAYRAVGGDRCVFGELDFGEESKSDEPVVQAIVDSLLKQNQLPNNNPNIIALVDTQIVPIKPGDFEQPEDQIVAYVKAQCEQRGIPPENFYFDSGMRTSLVTAFSRLWSPNVNSVDCGGKPTEQKVSDGIDVKACDYYSKKITQIWYSVRLIIEAGQFRGMTEDVMMEFAAREWTMVGANKIEVEPKEKMKLKIGRSPDLADAVAIGCWGAVLKGFVIRNMSSKESVESDNRWKRDLKEKSKALWHGSSLVHT